MSIIKSLSVGNGDMFYIKHNTDSFTTIDCCLSDENCIAILAEIRCESAEKSITRFISTHPDDDHIRGIEYFEKVIGIYNFYCVANQATKEDETDSFNAYCKLRDSDKVFHLYDGCSRKWLNQSDNERDGSGINFLWPNTSNRLFKDELVKALNGEAFNNLSPIFTYSIKQGVEVMWMGDIETTFLENVKMEIQWPQIDILFAPHHGRDSGKVPSDILKKLNPQVIIIGEAPSQYLNYYQGYNIITQLSAGNITFDCREGWVHIYVSEPSYSVKFLHNLREINMNYGNYIGSLQLGLGYYLGSFTTKGV
ncbi:MAG: hypothetical protein LBD30_06940 [Verrucomicrobiales bacterium]|jgi:beta-lactamase superfamily II metal-dependent hydrolase|nr:hypothetical protein [Verrucomicrobiales bacterium]